MFSALLWTLLTPSSARSLQKWRGVVDRVKLGFLGGFAFGERSWFVILYLCSVLEVPEYYFNANIAARGYRIQDVLFVEIKHTKAERVFWFRCEPSHKEQTATHPQTFKDENLHEISLMLRCLPACGWLGYRAGRNLLNDCKLQVGYKQAGMFRIFLWSHKVKSANFSSEETERFMWKIFFELFFE